MLLPLFKSLADETRLRLLHLLSRGELSVQDLTEILGMGQSRISRHLKILHDSGLLQVKRQGTWSYYRVDPDNSWIRDFWQLLLPRLQETGEVQHDLVLLARRFDAQKRASRDFFDRHARQWDLLKQTALPLVPYHGELLELLGAGDALVEVGIGTGGLLAELSRSWVRIVGIDQSQAMLDEASRRIASLTSEQVSLRLGEMSHLPVADQGADAVLMNMVLHHAPQPPQVLQEVARVLRPGGRLVIADLLRHSQDWAREALADLWLGFVDSEIRDWLAQSRFVKIQIRSIPASNRQQGVLLVVAHQPDSA